MNLEGRVAIVTGGGRGVGHGCSLALARAGADVALTYRKDELSARKTANTIESMGRRALAIQCDQTVEQDVIEAAQRVFEQFGHADIVVCNAGVASRGQMLRDTSTDEMRRLFDTHVMGSFWLVREMIDSMRAHNRGHVIFISSVATRHYAARGGPYSMAKTAMESIAKVLAKEEGPNGIRVNVIAPGLVETEMGRRLMRAREGKELEDLQETFPFGRICQPEDIGNLAAFLCSEQGSYISGQVIYVDGGGVRRIMGEE
jgi:3-oxoacyl-[acyl-carrier protein] reductase